MQEGKWYLIVVPGFVIVSAGAPAVDMYISCVGKAGIKQFLQSGGRLLDPPYRVIVWATSADDADEANEILECIPENTVQSVDWTLGTPSRAFYERQRESCGRRV